MKNRFMPIGYISYAVFCISEHLGGKKGEEFSMFYLCIQKKKCNFAGSIVKTVKL